MRIVIATPLFPPDIGGPATYSEGLAAEFRGRGIDVRVVSFGSVRHLPKGFSHALYALRLMSAAMGADLMIVLDPVSVGIPAILSNIFQDVPLIARIGGDTVWERYVSRTGKMVPLSKFYSECGQDLSVKERVMGAMIRYFLTRVKAVCFSTEWQRVLWELPYRIPREKSQVVENVFPAVESGVAVPDEKRFLWAGRDMPIKNVELLRSAFTKAKTLHPEISLVTVTGVMHEVLLREIDHAYALILPSLSDISPNFILEGIGRGRPFILTKETGMRDALTEFGIFIDPLSEVEIGDAISRMLEPEVYAGFRDRLLRSRHVRTYKEIADEFLQAYAVSR